MDLHNGRLLWTDNLTELEFNRNTTNKHYDAIIVGGGLSGTLCAYMLAQEGMKLAIIDKRRMATGSTMANTGLLHSLNDIMLKDLIAQIGETKAVRFYRMCQEAIDKLEEATASLPISSEFKRRKTLYYASNEEDAVLLRKEYETLRQFSLDAEFWNRGQIENHFPFSKHAAIVTHQDAEMNPFQFSIGILHHLKRLDVELFNHVTVHNITNCSSGIELLTSMGTLKSENVIFATGYETPPHLSRASSNLDCTFVMASEPIKDLSPWKDRMLIWETKRPYLYLRTTADGRIIAGGLDEKLHRTSKSKEWIRNRAELLRKNVSELFPMLEIKTAFSWGAVFGSSYDQLPLIGRHPARERIYYLLGYGGNGIVYSMLGSIILRDLILERPNKDADIVKLER
ncbi:NAD(P)/FAD-dependent oxidoreductase [Mesobacillus subterraneus]|uniref:NAD(P)/FAD-dependent oxidoreductase n=1 Tax=Mesobacillus subterraneus TaxID=285983 RepID=UPI0014739B20|nr:FAD-dependent oxidoreductase [Mesobacillus subterraneus]